MSKKQEYKALVFNVDDSLSTLGSKEKQEEIFGFPPVSINGGLNHINNLLDKALKVEKEPIVHPVLGETGDFDYKVVFSEKGKKLGVNALIIDTISMLGTYERSRIMKDQNLLVMDMRSWGLYGSAMEKFINKLRMCDFPVICTAHLDSDQDEQGAIIEYPAIKGSMKKDCGRYFDVIAYSRISKDAQGKATKYSWIVQADRRHIMAKNRGNVLDPIIPQDINHILEEYKKVGNDAPKILILAHSGGGKSWSLQTINPTQKEEDK